MHNDGYEKHVCILGGCQVLYLDQNKIDKYTYNGSQLNRDMIISLANNNPNYKFYVVTTCMAARTSNEAIELTNSYVFIAVPRQICLGNLIHYIHNFHTLIHLYCKYHNFLLVLLVLIVMCIFL